jgi:hypothetical protein
MFDAIDRFSPAVRVDRAAVELVPKNLLEGLWSRARFRAQQGRRYKSALLALWRLELAPEVRADLAGAPLPLDRRFTASRYHHRAHVSHDAVLARLAEPSTNLRVMVDWDYSQNSGVIHEQFARLRRFASAHEIALYAVLMPERSEVRALYGEGVWERYAELVRASLIDTPLLDLREFLRDDEFFDATHADVHGARRVSERVARFVAAGGEVQ